MAQGGGDADHAIDDASGDDDSDDVIDLVRDATFKYNQAEFERKLRALSAESNLPRINDAQFEEGLSSRKRDLSQRQSKHEDWIGNFRQKKVNILERLGIILKSRSNRFHNVCDILSPREKKETGNSKQGDWPQIVDLGEQMRQQPGFQWVTSVL